MCAAELCEGAVRVPVTVEGAPPSYIKGAVFISKGRHHTQCKQEAEGAPFPPRYPAVAGMLVGAEKTILFDGEEAYAEAWSSEDRCCCPWLHLEEQLHISFF